LILSNPVLVIKDPATGELRGVSIDLGRSLAASLGVQFEPIGYPNPAALTRSLGKNEWDIAFIGLDPTRAAVVDFSQPYMEVDNSYLVPANSRIRTIADADQPAVRIAVPEGSVPDTYLSRNLKNATLVRVPGGQAPLIDVLMSGRADAYAENAHMLTGATQNLPGSRVLDGRYTAVEHAVALPKGRSAGLTYVRAFIEQAKASGQVNAAIERAGLRRVTIPAKASTN
jgi:polar amino acid transport system substrate-binding protein